jgi:outer membrane protein assembly factor BamB
MILARVAAAEVSVPLKDPASMIQAANLTGGIVVSVDLTDGAFLSGFALNDKFTIQALAKSQAAVDEARKTLQQKGIYGQVSVTAYDGTELPYIDNLVNMVLCPVTTSVPPKELFRVIAPGGMLVVKSAEGWRGMVKSRPEGMDEWNQHLYGADNTGASFDTVGPTQRMRWHNTPEHGRSKSAMPSVTSMVSANGLLFTIEDRATTEDVNAPKLYNLVARDAFNGIELWKRLLPGWENLGSSSIKNMPTEVQRLLASIGSEVYSPLGYDESVAQMNGKTGEIMQVYQGTEATKEFLISDGTLFGVRGEAITAAMQNAARKSSQAPAPLKRELYAIDLQSGKLKWKMLLPENYLLGTFCIKDGALAFADKANVGCLRASDGVKVWETPYTFAADKKASKPKKQSAETIKKKAKKKKKAGDDSEDADELARGEDSGYATLVMAEGKLFCSGNKTLDAYDLKTGKRIWRGVATPNYMKTADLFYAAGLIWSGNLQGLDPSTGKVVRTLSQKMTGPMSHDRCWRNKITNRYFINSKTGGIDLVNLEGKGEFPSPWVRSTCGLGPMPANNMIYTGPYVCMCSIGSIIPGFNALYCDNIDDPAALFELKLTPHLTKGPAFGQVSGQPAGATDWPTYRGAADRGAMGSLELGKEVSEKWMVKIGSRPTAPVLVGSTVYTASKDDHAVYALDVASGNVKWKFTADGSIDSPPTYYNGMLLVGCRNGSVYGLRATDGVLAWTFNGLPYKRIICDQGALESAWPINGSVLIHKDLAYFSAGRSSFMDGGVALFALNPQTGAVVHQTVMSGPYDDADKLFPSVAGAFRDKGCKADVLSADNGLIYMRQQAFEDDLTMIEMNKLKVSHLVASPGFLDDSPQHRTYWTVDLDLRYGGPMAITGKGPVGDTIAFDGTIFYEVRGYIPGRNMKGRGRDFDIRDTFAIYSGRKAAPDEQGAWKGKARVIPETGSWMERWETPVPFAGHAIAAGNNVVVAAGVPLLKSYSLKEANDSLEGKKGGMLALLSSESGAVLKQILLPAPPTWDGIALGQKQFVITMKDGSVACFGGK